LVGYGQQATHGTNLIDKVFLNKVFLSVPFNLLLWYIVYFTWMHCSQIRTHTHTYIHTVFKK